MSSALSNAVVEIRAIRTLDGEIIDALSVGTEEWAAMCSDPPGSYADQDGCILFAHTTRRGYRVFLCQPADAWLDWDHHKLRLVEMQVQCIQRGRDAGYAIHLLGGLSEHGLSEVDVAMVGEANGRKIAFLLQTSFRHLADFERCTQALASAGMKAVWLVRSMQQFRQLQTAIYFELARSNFGDADGHDDATPCLPWLCAFPALPLEADRSGVSDLVVTLPRKGGGTCQRPFADFVIGVLAGRLSFSRTAWVWKEF